MAKITPPQDIPSELLDGYRATLGEVRPDDGVRKRYPYRVPPLQTLVGHPSVKQKAQRTRFKDSIIKFKALSTGNKQRWYATMPEWGSLLWYYNWFMLNGIPNLWGVVPGGAAILKQIVNKKDSIPIVGKTVTHGGNVDPDKCVVMLWGASINRLQFENPEGWQNYAYYTVYPVWNNLTATTIDVSWGIAPNVAADVCIQIIEYI